eukprot:286407-Pelagomonas_calceolata.AAC.2
MEAQRAQQRAVLSILPPAEPSPISRLMGSAGSLGSHGSGRMAKLVCSASFVIEGQDASHPSMLVCTSAAAGASGRFASKWKCMCHDG